jgi:hypothetical protein
MNARENVASESYPLAVAVVARPAVVSPAHLGRSARVTARAPAIVGGEGKRARTGASEPPAAPTAKSAEGTGRPARSRSSASSSKKRRVARGSSAAMPAASAPRATTCLGSPLQMTRARSPRSARRRATALARSRRAPRRCLPPRPRRGRMPPRRLQGTVARPGLWRRSPAALRGRARGVC